MKKNNIWLAAFILIWGFFNSFAMEKDQAEKMRLSDFYKCNPATIRLEIDDNKFLFFVGKIKQENFAGYSALLHGSDEVLHIFRVHSAQDVRTFYLKTCKKTDNPDIVELTKMTTESAEHAEQDKRFSKIFDEFMKRLNNERQAVTKP